ncbi:MAG TPA: CBS domain-containing protein [Gemmatimonadaceae bacterium]
MSSASVLPSRTSAFEGCSQTATAGTVREYLTILHSLPDRRPAALAICWQGKAQEGLMKARDIMQWNPLVVTPTEAVSHAAEQMRYESDACLPVVRDVNSRHLVGVITARDLVTRCMARRHGVDCTVADHMTPLPLRTARPDDDADELLHIMRDAEIRRIPVVDDDGVLGGMVREHDLAEALKTFVWLGTPAPRPAGPAID